MNTVGSTSHPWPASHCSKAAESAPPALRGHWYVLVSFVLVTTSPCP